MGQGPPRSLIRRVLLGLTAAAAALLLGAPPVPAQPQPQSPDIDKAVISINPAGPALAKQPTVDGSFHINGSINPNFTSINLTLSWTGTQPKPPVNVPYCVTPPQPPTPACQTDSSGDLEIKSFALPTIFLNGPYSLVATANGTDFTQQPAPTKSSNTVGFGLAVPARTPTKFATTVNKDRSVTLSWDKNTEPDLTSTPYQIFRKAPGEKGFRLLALATQPSGPRAAVNDDYTTAQGGDYLYHLVAVRNGASGDSSTTAPSPPTEDSKVTVPEPPPGTPKPTAPAPSGPGAPPPVLKSSSGTTNLSRISSASNTAPPTTESVSPDPGFVRGLPFANRGTTPGEEGDNSAVALTPGSKHKGGGGLLIPAATGAILFVGAFQLRWLMRRIDAPLPPTLN